MIHVVVSASGKDRPGFVHDITSVIKAAEGNIEHQRSSRMADEYAVMLLFTVSDEGVAARVIGKLRALQGPELLVHARQTQPGRPHAFQDAVSAEIQASGADQPGILEAVTSLLVKHGINIDSMDFDVEGAPMTGDQLFRMDAHVSIPSGVEVERLRGSFRDLEEAYNFDILFRCPV